MGELATAYVRIRPSLDPERRDALEHLAQTARDLATAIDNFVGQFAEEPPNLEETND